mgnify:CR=1 FL=1
MLWHRSPSGHVLMQTLSNFAFSTVEMWDEYAVVNGTQNKWHVAIYDTLQGQQSRYLLNKVQLELYPNCAEPEPSVQPKPSGPVPFIFVCV